MEPQQIKDLIAFFSERKEEIEAQMKIINKIIELLQKICVHEWTPDGNDSHYDYERCTRCGLRNKI
jgi:hypothetical protein